MDEEELQKRFTDCIYFLASPLTCKKGIECAYRHSEIARLNPRDCWYWLGGCCYNPDCAFRHPPLEGLKEAHHESLKHSNGPTLPVDKANIPCYFYSKGFCNKADRCSFLHEATDPDQAMVKNEVPCEKKTSAGNNSGSTTVPTVYTNPDTPDTEQTKYTHTVINHTQDLHQLASRSESVESEDDLESEEFVEGEENVVQSEEIVVENESDVFNDVSSDDYIEREKWLELSPRFDVFVEGESERLEYQENDIDFFSFNNKEDTQLDFHYSECECVGFDKIPRQARVSIFNRLSFKKKNISKKLISNAQRGSDLRDQMKKSQVVDFDRRVWRNFRTHGSRGEVDFDDKGWLRKAVPRNRYMLPLKKPPRFLSSDISRFRKPSKQRMAEFRKESALFTGPKTLDQIKEEKKRFRENRDLGSNKRSGSGGFFTGPRPLSEILESKRKVGS